MTEIEAHITGTVWKIECAVGDAIEEGDTVAILESMKMEMPVEAEESGTVAEILCDEGQAVSEGDALEAFPLPTLAALPGHTIGGGLELALACDLRVAAEGIQLGMPPAKLGLVYSHTGVRRFIDAVGAARTRELFLLGRYIDAPTALQWGLVNRVAPAPELEPVSLELALELAGNAPLAQAGNKRVIAALLEAEGKLPEQVTQQLIELRRASFASEDMREGVRAFAEKRPARWRGQ